MQRCLVFIFVALVSYSIHGKKALPIGTSTESMKMHATHNPLPAKMREEVCNLLTTTLATTTDLQLQLKQAHWNVKGPSFYSLHLLFDEIAAELAKSVDIIAERIVALGGTAYGTLQNTGQRTILAPYPINIFSAAEHSQALTKRLGDYCAHLTDNIKTTDALGDMATNDIYIQLAKQYEKRLWFVEAFLQ